ncbi:hypothetical protein HK098_001750 [Nowakowskiella sp. JEL0407]|nr:hypothetical protein HK098_001750 [Nowakowskiella sp. JEL0407]
MASVVKFLHIIENLKRTKRTGWVLSGIPEVESISDHMYRMSVMAMLIKDPNVNKDRIVKIAISHDIAESIAGDIAPAQKISASEKYALEKSAITQLVSTLNSTPESLEIQSLWNEYEECQTPEAKIVKDLDKFEMIVQGLEYEKRYGKRLDSFFESTRGKFVHAEVLEWVEALYKEREEFWNSKN